MGFVEINGKIVHTSCIDFGSESNQGEIYQYKKEIAKARLIKKSKHFKLISKDDNGEEFVIATSSDYAIKALSGLKNPITDETVQIKKLSIENCQAIELGYDLDELAIEYASKYLKRPVTLYSPLEANSSEVVAFQKGFKKALEILGDKKFSDEDIAKAYDKGQMLNIKGGLQTGKNYVKTLQKNEWDVEIEMVCVIGCENLILNGENSVCCGNKKPKLDSEGCLILKKI